MGYRLTVVGVAGLSHIRLRCHCDCGVIAGTVGECIECPWRTPNPTICYPLLNDEQQGRICVASFRAASTHHG